MIATTSTRHVLLVRRPIRHPDDLAYFYAYVPDGQPLTLTVLVSIAGIRWTVEEDFQQSKGTAGLDHTQVRRYTSWKRHITLAIAALAITAVTVALRRREHPTPVLPTHGNTTTPADGDYGTIALTVPEAHRLLILTDQLRDLPEPLAHRRTQFHQHWADWRRKTQARTRWHHHRTRLATLNW